MSSTSGSRSTHRIWIGEITASAGRRAEAEAWRDRVLLPQLADAARGAPVRLYGAFNVGQWAAIVSLPEGSRGVTPPAPPAGLALRADVVEQTCEVAQGPAPAGLAAEARDASPLLYTVRFKVPADWHEEFDRWYEQEHLPMIYANRHWSLSRRYAFAGGAAPDGSTHLAVHYLTDARGFDAPELVAARATPWRARFLAERWFTDVEKMIYFRQTPAAR